MPAASQDPHAGHDIGAMDKPASPGPAVETPPPATAGSGPPRAADAIWGADAMQASREDLRRTHGDFPVFWFQGDRFETQVRDGADAYLWDIQGYYGGPTERLWFKSEGEGEWGSAIFLHVAREDYAPTKGCVAFSQADLLELVPLIGPETRIRVLTLPANEAATAPDAEAKALEDFDEADW